MKAGRLDDLKPPTDVTWDDDTLRIDCGSSSDYVDEKGRRWRADRLFTDGALFGAITEKDGTITIRFEQSHVSSHTPPINGLEMVRVQEP